EPYVIDPEHDSKGADDSARAAVDHPKPAGLESGRKQAVACLVEGQGVVRRRALDLPFRYRTRPAVDDAHGFLIGKIDEDPRAASLELKRLRMRSKLEFLRQ